MDQPTIRHLTEGDIEALVDIYLQCFPDRVREVFGGGHRRVFVEDYLRFYLTWDPANAWACASNGRVLGAIMAPCRYAPMRAALVRGQVFSWLWHLSTGRYGFPINIFRLFLTSGFAFSNDSVIQELWGNPYIHYYAVAPDSQGQGIGSALLKWTLDQYQQQDIECCWVLVHAQNQPAVKSYEKFGFRLYGPSERGNVVMIWGTPHITHDRKRR